MAQVTRLDMDELDLYSANTAAIYPEKLEMITALVNSTDERNEQLVELVFTDWCNWLKLALEHYSAEFNTQAVALSTVIYVIAFAQISQEIEEVMLGNWDNLRK